MSITTVPIYQLPLYPGVPVDADYLPISSSGVTYKVALLDFFTRVGDLSSLSSPLVDTDLVSAINSLYALDASLTQRGLISISAQSFAGLKTFRDGISLSDNSVIKFYNSANTFGISLKASSSQSSNVTFTLPTADGTNGQVLKTNGSGQLSFATILTASLTNAHILVGNGSNVATDVAMSGNVTISNSGVTTISNGAIVNSMVTDVAWSKITGTPTTLAGYGITNAFNYVPLSRTITINGLTQDLSANVSWTETNLPDQTGHNGEYLTTNGTVASWAAIGASVASVSGTTNRITSTGGTDPVIDISALYIGQSSITTVGVLTSGTWRGATVEPAYGGTGVNNGISTFTIGGNFSMIGAFTFAGTITGNTTVTFPTSGTLATTTDLSGYLPLIGAAYTTTSGNGLAITTSTLTSGSLISFTSTGTVAASNTQTVLTIGTSGVNSTSSQTTTGLNISNTHTGTSSINVALILNASGGSSNYAIQTLGGDIKFNTSAWIYNATNNNITHSATSAGTDLSYTIRNNSTSGSTSLYALNSTSVGFGVTTYGSAWVQTGILDIASTVQISTGLTTNLWVGAHDFSVWTGAAVSAVKSFYINTTGFGMTNNSGFYVLRTSGGGSPELFMSLEDSLSTEFFQGSSTTTSFNGQSLYGDGNNFYNTYVYNSAYVTSGLRNTVVTTIGTTYISNLSHTSSYSIQQAGTNVFKINTSGNIDVGVWNSTAIGATFGGTGQTVYVVGDLLSANTTTTLSKITAVAAGSIFASAGIGTLPSWTTTPSITTSLTVPLIYGGTGAGQVLSIKGTSNGSPVNDGVDIYAGGITVLRAVSSSALAPVKVFGTSGGGLQLGNYNGTFGGFWSGAVTPSTSNYALIASSTRTAFNCVTDMFFYNSDSTILAQASTAGWIFKSLVTIGTGSSSSPSTVAMFGASSLSSELNVLSLVNAAAASTGNGVGINFHMANNAAPSAKISAIYTAAGDTDLIFYTGHAGLNQVMKIAGLNGNVGIGVNPDASYKVNITGKVQINAGSGNDAITLDGYGAMRWNSGNMIEFGGFGGTWQTLNLYANGIIGLTIDSVGNITGKSAVVFDAMESTTSATFTMANSKRGVKINNVAGTAVTMNSSPFDGEERIISNVGGVGTFTLVANSGQSVVGGGPFNSGAYAKYSTTGTVWVCFGS